LTYLTEVIADAPVHFWRCADPGGLLAHDIGSAPEALLNSGANPTKLGYSGPNVGGGSFLQTTDGSVLKSYTLFALALPYTVECMYWPHDVAQGASYTVVSLDNPATVDIRITESVASLVNFVGGGVQVVSLTALVRQTWNHLAMTVSGAGAIATYINGVAGPAGVGGAGIAAGGYCIGGRTDNSIRASGCISEVAFYAAALTAARIAAHDAAVDQRTQRPIYTQFGGASYPSSTPSPAPTSADTALILSSVRKTY
jgi:hypothetical protein